SFWLCSHTCWGCKPCRAATARLSSPRRLSSSPPSGPGNRYTRSPPAGSHSASSTGRGQTAARATDVVVTPGEPLSAPIAMSATDQPVPRFFLCAAGGLVEVDGDGLVTGGDVGVVTDWPLPPAGSTATPIMPFEALHATAPASAGLTATTTSVV